MKDKLKDHIERSLVRRGAQKAAPGFADTLGKLTDNASAEYDRIRAAGKTDLEAYRGAVEKVTPDIDRSAALLKVKEVETDAKTSGNDKTKNEKKDPENETISALESAAHAILWLVTVVAYFAISLIFNCWHVSWIMFLSAAAGSIVIDMVFALNRGRTIVDEWDNLNGIIWLVVTAIYFLVSFLTGKWAFTWLIFIAAVAATVILDAVKKTLVRSQGEESLQGSETGKDGGGESDK